ncbi:hypothetical protein ElyMa_004657200 [Elysia marginata]|uniref:Uncharacterized protein n=1 Tax=Elysia marginata TaxID=1093978 RepID=A0AAV4I338_9GAST|nr:hypothetical protein ElyMa_004657200 [Elysia marginata]
MKGDKRINFHGEARATLTLLASVFGSTFQLFLHMEGAKRERDGWGHRLGIIALGYAWLATLSTQPFSLPRSEANAGSGRIERSCLFCYLAKYKNLALFNTTTKIYQI